MIGKFLADYIESVFVFSVFFGALVHWYRAYLHDPVGTGALWKYLVQDQPGATSCTVVALIVMTAAALAVGFTGMNPWMVFAGGVTAGYTGDSFFNKGSSISTVGATQ